VSFAYIGSLVVQLQLFFYGHKVQEIKASTVNVVPIGIFEITPLQVLQ